jgi:hypothetical protein
MRSTFWRSSLQLIPKELGCFIPTFLPPSRLFYERSGSVLISVVVKTIISRKVINHSVLCHIAKFTHMRDSAAIAGFRVQRMQRAIFLQSFLLEHCRMMAKV